MKSTPGSWKLLFASILLLAFGTSQFSAAATLCVNTGGTGGCYKTIGAAVAAAAAGSTINVAAGTYKEDVVIGKSLYLIGAKNTTTIVNAIGLSNAFYVDGLDNPKLSNVTIQGFTAENANFEGIAVTSASNVTIWGNVVSKNDQSLDVADSSCPGLPAWETSEGLDCGEGIHLSGTAYSTVQNNVSEGNSGGILLSDDTAKSSVQRDCRKHLQGQSVRLRNYHTLASRLPKHRKEALWDLQHYGLRKHLNRKWDCCCGSRLGNTPRRFCAVGNR